MKLARRLLVLVVLAVPAAAYAATEFGGADGCSADCPSWCPFC